MTRRQRTGFVVLGLLIALAAVLGAACLYTHGHAMPVAAMPSAAYHEPEGGHHEHACVSPGHEQCGAKTAVDTPTTGPGPYPHPEGLPVLADAQPAPAIAQATAYGAASRPPNLYVLQVLRNQTGCRPSSNTGIRQLPLYAKDFPWVPPTPRTRPRPAAPA
ncbi:hypothetical protein [Streptomyces albicerus]|uniref:hypothetical protein n=1 Tax=Streptomyces albicerus TaxID=2569859 RepID=UPI00124B8BF4|nr:hypothetical protein [Streptomyces albicerus]